MSQNVQTPFVIMLGTIKVNLKGQNMSNIL